MLFVHVKCGFGCLHVNIAFEHSLLQLSGEKLLLLSELFRRYLQVWGQEAHAAGGLQTLLIQGLGDPTNEEAT